MECMDEQNKPVNALRPEISRFEFVGREDEIRSIDAAVAMLGVRVVNIQGPGGIGKTSMLNVIQKRAEMNKTYYMTEIIDFFDMSVNTPSGFMDRLISCLPRDAVSLFDPYYKAGNRVEQMETAGIVGEMLKEEQDKLATIFMECLNRICSKNRCLVLMDTFEESGNRIREWLSAWIKRTENVVFIVAGRENASWKTLLSAEHETDSVVHLELGPLNMEASRKLVQRSEYGGNAGDEELEKLQILSGGYPILLSLAVDKRWPRTLPGKPRPRKESTFIGEKFTLEALQAMDNEALERVRNEFREELINGALNMINLQPCAVVILFMALLPRYFTAEMFIHVESMDIENARATLAGFQQWAFVKHDEKNDSYRLHDVIRDMVLRHTWPAVDITGGKRRRISEKVADYYSSKLLCDIRRQENEWKEKQAQYRIAEGQRDETVDLSKTVHQTSELAKQAHELKIKKAMFQAQEIYYRILADYETGIEAYQLLFEYMLWIKNIRAKDMLKRELHLALIDIQREYPSCLRKLDQAREQIIIDRAYQEAIDILNRIFIEPDHERNPYISAVTVLYRGIALSFKGEMEDAKRNIGQAIDDLRNLENAVNIQSLQDSFYLKGVRRSLARAFGSLGFGCLNAGRVSDAITAYENALTYSKNGGMDLERSYHLNDLGYAYACLGQFDRAEFYCNKGLAIREKLPSEYLCGLSCNTLGMVKYMSDFPGAGKPHCENALAIFQRMGDRHGTGLAHRALGGIFSRMADRENSMNDLEKAKTHLLKALDIFIRHGVPVDPIYMAETFLRMGLMYRTWHRLALSHDVDEKQVEEHFSMARYCFQRCIKEFKRAQSPLRQANATSRLADFYLDAGKPETAESEIRKMENILSENGCDTADISEISLIEMKNNRPEYLHPMSRLHFLKARLSFYRFKEQGISEYLTAAAQSFTMAYAFMVHFSPEAFDIRGINNMIASCLSELDDDSRDVFIDELKNAADRYPGADFTKMMNRLKDAAII